MPAELRQLDSEESLRMFSPSSNMPVKRIHLRLQTYLQGDTGVNISIPGMKVLDQDIFSPLLNKIKVPISSWSPTRAKSKPIHIVADNTKDGAAASSKPLQMVTEISNHGSALSIETSSDTDEKHILRSCSSFTQHDFSPQKSVSGTFDGKISEIVESLARLSWHQTVAQWRHDEMLRMLTAQEPSHHFTKHLRTASPPHLRWENHLKPESNNQNGFCPSKLLNYTPKRLSNILLQIGELPLCLPVERSAECNFIASQRHLWPDIDGGVNSLRHDIGEVPIDRKLNTIVDLLFSIAEKSHKQFLKSITDIATFASNHLEADVTSLLKPCTSVKTKEAIVGKAQRKYGGDLLQVKDILRAQLIFPDEASLVRTLQHLQKTSNAQGSIVSTYKVVRIKNLFRTTSFENAVPTDLPTGYRHVLVNLRMPNGFIAGMC
jgi:hypothetical protein